MNKDFLLRNELAKTLYFDTACSLPIVDYHNHLSKNDIICNKKFTNITELWITPDPYKHRLMRIKGIPEKYIMGESTDKEKFCKWCEIFPELLGTPVYDWSLLELSSVFKTDIFPCKENEEKLWCELNGKLCDERFSAVGLVKNSKVEYAAPCSSITEDVSCYTKDGIFHPSLRGDDIVMPDVGFIKKLSDAANMKIGNLTEFFTALGRRLDEFTAVGCKFSDHALDDSFEYFDDDGKSAEYFDIILNGKELEAREKGKLKSAILRFMACEYARRGYVMQLHIGALRKTSTRLRLAAGAAGGYAGIGTDINISDVTRFLDDVEKTAGTLPKTIVYTLNPSYNAALSILSGSYSKDGVSSVIAQGPAWWWCDHMTGIKEVLETVSVYSVLSEFVGMTTDSRSFLSFVRHDYFRRVLCSWISEKVERGEYPNRIDDLKNIVIKMAYQNAKDLINERI